MPTVQCDYFKFARACNGDIFTDDDHAVTARRGADEHHHGGHDASRAFSRPRSSHLTPQAA
eukprot:4380822-Pleurochrysis_carterae.AAC.1